MYNVCPKQNLEDVFIHLRDCSVLPEVEDVEIEVRNEDLKIDTYRSSGAGGQHVNTTDSACVLRIFQPVLLQRLQKNHKFKTVKKH